MTTSLRRALLLLAVSALLAGIAAPSALASDAGPLASAAAKAKGKKCKKKGKGKAKKAKKCKKRSSQGPSTSSPGLPGKPVNPDPPPPPPAPVVSSLAIVPTTLLAGEDATGEVTLAQSAPSGGVPVSLESQIPSRASVPASVHVAAGQSSASFAINTTAGPSVTVPITAFLPDSGAAADLSLVEEPSVLGLSLARRCYPDVGLSAFGANRVTLDVPAPADTAVGLVSSDPTALSVPDSVVVASGAKTAFFGVDTLMATPAVTVTATLNDSTAVDTASIRDSSSPDPVAESLSISPNLIQPGATATGSVTLDCEPVGGPVTVTLTSDNSDASVPASVVVPEDSLSATFPITAVPTAHDGQATITATLGGSVQGVVTIEVFGT